MESDIKYIVTHSGPVFRGEFLAICLCLANATGTPTVFRRDPTEEELNDPHIIVLDSGRRYEPKLLNFDSHGFNRDCDPACAFSLVALELGIDEWVRRSSSWLPATEMLDTRGPLGLSKMLNTEWPVLSQMMSPIEGYFLRQLGEVSELTVADAAGCASMLYATMLDIGQELLEHTMDFAERTTYLDKNAQAFVVNGIEVILVPAELRADRPTMALNEWSMEKHPHARISVTPDPKGEGWSFFRTSDTKRVDLSVLKDHEGITFAHHAGFIAKTKELCDLPTIREMLTGTIREPVAEKPPAKRWGSKGNGGNGPRRAPHNGQNNYGRPQGGHQGGHYNNGGGNRQHRPHQQNQRYQQPQQRPHPQQQVAAVVEPGEHHAEEWSPPNPFAQVHLDHTAV